MYTDFLKRKFPHNENEGLYVSPKLPAKKLGKALASDTRIKSPNDVIALHVDDGMFSSTFLIFTDTRCYFGGGMFLLEDLRSVEHNGKALIMHVNQAGSGVAKYTVRTKNETVAKLLVKVLGDLVYHDPNEQEAPQKSYEDLGYDPAEIDWLKLRDEVMITIDQLHERFMDGKLDLIQYEEKKEALLKRL